MIGFIYYYGWGVQQDYKEQQMVQESAEKGFTKSELQLGFMYAIGEGLPENPKGS